MKTNTSNSSVRLNGLTFVEVMIIVAILGLLTLIVIPNMLQAQDAKKKKKCSENLIIISEAKDAWAFEMKKLPTDVPTDESIFNPTSHFANKPVCPSHGTYTLGAVNEKPRCSIAAHTSS